ncbi:MAG: metallophosphoesterase family protein [Desulfobacteraceae bacterium]|nr:metallophosphoesterase family protein [Desulfobacteraceae bacterium]
MTKKRYKIGVISDTHGKMNPKIAGAFKGVDHIIHAGDICGVDVLESLAKLAPVTAVKGNMDFGELSTKLHATESVEFGNAFIYVLHIPHMLDIEPDKEGFNVIITGHTHIPLIKTRNNVLYLNPGSTTFPKQNNSPTVALLYIDEKEISAEIIKLK